MQYIKRTGIIAFILLLAVIVSQLNNDFSRFIVALLLIAFFVVLGYFAIQDKRESDEEKAQQAAPKPAAAPTVNIRLLPLLLKLKLKKRLKIKFTEKDVSMVADALKKSRSQKSRGAGQCTDHTHEES